MTAKVPAERTIERLEEVCETMDGPLTRLWQLQKRVGELCARWADVRQRGADHTESLAVWLGQGLDTALRKGEAIVSELERDIPKKRSEGESVMGSPIEESESTQDETEDEQEEATV